ncbi:hypothetical protein IM697_23600 [Streptomyces ferrugineus]|uniref:Uncharacterized protein n=1 Tax=Streptomyces ferrugineus TaxID=1413221 RepID=A0A7M2SAF3_9ACTN|nr:hypothetical protein [Streptomyces ferrugineus]QOV33232.1 hypothetical protein IM697_23600 [Streptomyces ferrugineus]
MTARASAPLGSLAPAAVAGRVFLQVGHRRAARYRDRVDASVSGLVLTGDGALARAGQLREEGFEAALLVDEACYREAEACEEAPFPVLDDGPAPLFGDPLEHQMLAHLAFADAALAPTGYLRAGAVRALEAAAVRVARLGDPRVVLTVPVDAGWFQAELLKQLTDVLGRYPGPKALIVGGSLPGTPAGVAGLVRLLDAVPDAGVLRTGLGAFGGLARGAGFAAFGADGSMRRAEPPEPAKEPSRGGPSSPMVLFPELMNFSLGLTLARRLGDEVPACWCEQCQGEDLGRFTTMEHQTEAAGHNAAVLMEWIAQVCAIDVAGRGGWWRERCRQALDKYPVWNGRIQHESGFTPPAELAAWAELPAPQAAASRRG